MVRTIVVLPEPLVPLTLMINLFHPWLRVDNRCMITMLQHFGNISQCLFIRLVQFAFAQQIGQQTDTIATVVAAQARLELTLALDQHFTHCAEGVALPDISKIGLQHVAAIVAACPIVAAAGNIAIPLNDQLSEWMMTAFACHAIVWRQPQAGIVKDFTVSSNTINFILLIQVSNLHERSTTARPANMRIAFTIFGIFVECETTLMLLTRLQWAKRFKHLANIFN